MTATLKGCPTVSRRSSRNIMSSSATSSSPSRNLVAAALVAAVVSTSTSSLLLGVSAQESDTCIAASTGCNATLCIEEKRCSLHSTSYLLGKCCVHAGVKASLLAFEESAEWIPRIQEYNSCTGASVRIDYLAEGEDGMAEALLADVGRSDDTSSGEGIHDAYIVQGPWLPPVYRGLQSLSQFIKENEEFIQFTDINQASRSAVSYDGQVFALPLDTDYIAMGWRQDVFNKYNQTYFDEKGTWLTPPETIEELVETSEWLNGKDHNGDGEPDWGFCLTPQTNYFNAFVAPVFQTHLRECTLNEEGENAAYDCSRSEAADTGQNIFFDVDTFDPLIYNEGFRYAFELYWRFVRASNCQHQTANGQKCNRKTAFPTGRCAGVISMPGTMTNLLRSQKQGGKYGPPESLIMTEFLEDGQHFGRRAVFPGSKRVLNWNAPGRPLVTCDENNGAMCPLARNGVNYAPYFSEGGEAYALNGRQSKPKATLAMWDMFTWLAELPISKLPLSGVYRKSHLNDEFIDVLAEQWNSTVMAEDLRDVLQEYFKAQEDGGNPVQDLLMLGFDAYNDNLHTELHQNLVLQDVNDGGLFNMTDPSNSLDPVKDKEEFDERYLRFTRDLGERYDDVNKQQNGGALGQLVLWRESLNLRLRKDDTDICEDLLASDQQKFIDLGCLDVVSLEELCQTQEQDVEELSPGTCAEDNNNYITIVIVVCSIIGAILLAGLIYYFYKRYQNYKRIKLAHEQLMEATLNESVRALYQLDYPLHLIRGDEFLSGGKLTRHEVLRNTHKLTVLDSLGDVDAFIEAGKHVVFFSHQWTSFTLPDPSNGQYASMCNALKELVKQSGWDESLKDVFVWVDFSCIPQANPSTQNLAIRSLAAYASSATFFIICAPDTKHADLDDMCDLGTYQRRMWCRAEQVCHSMRNGTQGMYLAQGGGSDLVLVKPDFFQESLRVFDGDLTCCRLEHKGLSSCDRQSLVVPLLGLYGELFRASVEGIKGGNAEALTSVEAFLHEIERNQEEVFPRTFMRTSWRKNKRVVEEVLLFGDLIDRMKARVKSGVGFAIDDLVSTTDATSTKASDFVRHGGPGGYVSTLTESEGIHSLDGTV